MAQPTRRRSTVVVAPVATFTLYKNPSWAVNSAYVAPSMNGPTTGKFSIGPPAVLGKPPSAAPVVSSRPASCESDATNVWPLKVYAAETAPLASGVTQLPQLPLKQAHPP